MRLFKCDDPNLQGGQPLTVQGTFSIEKHVRRYTFCNEIDVVNRLP